MSGGFQHQMVVRQIVLGIDPPPSAHAEMEHHDMIARGVDQPIFGTPRKSGNLRAGQCLDEAGREGAPQIGAVDGHAGDGFTIQKTRQPAHGRLDFGKFGHGCVSNTLCPPGNCP